MIRKWLSRLFRRRPEEDLELEGDYIGYTVIDGETGMMLSVLMVCGCGNPVSRLVEGENTFFNCEHCDVECAEKPCDSCTAHFLFDAEAAKLGSREGFEYPEQEQD